jgi:hypothetical protein
LGNYFTLGPMTLATLIDWCYITIVFSPCLWFSQGGMMMIKFITKFKCAYGRMVKQIRKKCDQINLKQQKLHSIPNFNS